jgi:hypothetical protein
MRHDGTPDDPRTPDDDLDAWSDERHRELEELVALDRQAELARRLEHERAQQLERERRRAAELPPELRDADDDPLEPGPRRRLVMGSSRVLAAVALLAIVAVALTAFL